MSAQEEWPRIFFPYLLSEQERVQKAQKRFVHYCPAQAALSIISNREIWLRNSLCMNDWGEIRYGLDRVISYFSINNPKTSHNFWNLFELMHSGLAREIQQLFDGWIPDIRDETYMLCLSEHEEKEDQSGRLSMWRGYGPTTGVALVLNPGPMFSESDALHAYSYPVLYKTESEVETLFGDMVAHLNRHRDQLQNIDKENLKGLIFHMLKTFVICLKHPGFYEEKEWRVVYSPGHRSSEKILSDLQVVNGIPQKIHKIPLRDYPDEGLVGVEMPALIDRIIIGPNAQPLIVYNAFVEALTRAGVTDAARRVYCSNIPLRT